MKYIYKTLVSLLIFPFFSFGQGYIPFPDSLASWSITWSDATCFASHIPDGTYSYTMGSDTTINLDLYHSIYRVGLCNLCCIPPNPPLNGYVGAYRNDVTNKIVLWVSANNSTVDTLYNFNLNIGDTIKGPLAVLSSDAKITFIDSILLSGIYHRRFHFIGTLCEGDLIEGVGSTLGLVEFMKSFEGGGQLNCMTINHQTIYPTASYPCDLINRIKSTDNKIPPVTVIHDNLNSQNILKFSNYFDAKSNFRITVYDLQGSLIFQSFKFEKELFYNSSSGIEVISIINGGESVILKTSNY